MRSNYDYIPLPLTHHGDNHYSLHKYGYEDYNADNTIHVHPKWLKRWIDPEHYPLVGKGVVSFSTEDDVFALRDELIPTIDPSKPTLFLDNDGVWSEPIERMQTVRSAFKRHQTDLAVDLYRFTRGDYTTTTRLEQLLSVVQHYDFNIVVMSSWVSPNLPADHPQILAFADYLGWSKVVGSGDTAGDSARRWESVLEYVDKYNLDQWFYLDDMADRSEHGVSKVYYHAPRGRYGMQIPDWVQVMAKLTYQRRDQIPMEDFMELMSEGSFDLRECGLLLDDPSIDIQKRDPNEVLEGGQVIVEGSYRPGPVEYRGQRYFIESIQGKTAFTYVGPCSRTLDGPQQPLDIEDITLEVTRMRRLLPTFFHNSVNVSPPISSVSSSMDVPEVFQEN